METSDIQYVKELFAKDFHAIAPNNAWIQDKWETILGHYTDSSRHYHNIHHIADLLRLAEQYENHLTNPVVVRLAIYYHDLIYNVRRKDNELKSAQMAWQDLSEINIAEDDSDLVYDFIITTQAHEPTEHPDCAWFLDFDLATLGQAPEDYALKTKAIRQEYIMYPDELYNSGRHDAMKKFLDRPRIYYTDTFYELYEEQARENVEGEVGG